MGETYGADMPRLDDGFEAGALGANRFLRFAPRDPWDVSLAGRFRDALVEQRRMQLPGGLYERFQVHMAYDSCALDGGRLSLAQVQFLRDTRSSTGIASLDDLNDAVRHFRLVDRVIAGVGTPIGAPTLSVHHQTLVPDAGRHEAFIALTPRLPVRAEPTLEYAAAVHAAIMRGRPLDVVTGRVARALLLRMCLSAPLVPVLVPVEARDEYESALSSPKRLAALFRRLQEEFAAEYERFLRPA